MIINLRIAINKVNQIIKIILFNINSNKISKLRTLIYIKIKIVKIRFRIILTIPSQF
jgi:hypothetical protein